MNRFIPVLTLLLGFPGLLHAKEAGVSPWKADFRRVALEFSSTEVKNAKAYANSPNSQLSADSQTVVKGVFDFMLEYQQPYYSWNNGVFMEYGKTKLRPADGDNSSSENADKILLTSDYNRKMWRYADADVGPFGSLGYQTEFTANNDAPRQKILRGKGGIKLFNGEKVKELYAALVEELDMTYSREDMKTAWEVGGRAEYPLREGVKFQFEGYFRDYFVYSRYVGTDFRYELNFTSRMDVKLNDGFSLAPYVSYIQAQSRESKLKGSNTMIDIALSFSGTFDL